MGCKPKALELYLSALYLVIARIMARLSRPEHGGDCHGRFPNLTQIQRPLPAQTWPDSGTWISVTGRPTWDMKRIATAVFHAWQHYPGYNETRVWKIHCIHNETQHFRPYFQVNVIVNNRLNRKEREERKELKRKTLRPLRPLR